MRLGGLGLCFLLVACTAPEPTERADGAAGAAALAGLSGVSGGAAGGVNEAPGGAGAASSGAGAGGSGAGSELGGSATTGGGDGSASGAGGEAAELDPPLLARCQGSAPITCQLDAPNGNYDVTLDLGSDTTAGSTRVAAETGHYLGAASVTAPGQHAWLSFSVNVRAEQHDGGQSAPGNVLDLRLDGTAPQLRGLRLRAAPQAITVFIAGDSTVCDWVGSNTSAVSDDETGWGQALAQYFRAGAAVANYADSGETAGGFYGKFWPAARQTMKAGDYLFVQFGHNDQKSGDAVAEYRENLLRYVNDARDRQATPVLFTPVSRSGGSQDEPGFAGLDQQVRDLAASEQVALVDLTVLSREHYASVADKKLLFVDSGTHLSSRGADAVAALVASALRASELPLKAFVR